MNSVMKEKSNWKKLIEYINSKELGDTITRQELLKLEFVSERFDRNKHEYSSFRINNADKLSIATLDSYRRYLTVCTYLLDRVNTNKLPRGQYILDKYIPVDLSLSEIKKKAYGRK